MNNDKQTARRHDHRDCCAESECETGLRNNYFEGKRLSVDSFRVEQAYSLQRRRLLNRAIHGWGVVYGFELQAGQPSDPRWLPIGPGLALDPCGRELLQTDTPVAVKDIIILDEDGKRVRLENARDKASREPGIHLKPEDWWLLSVHYAEEDIAPLKITDSCRCEHREWDQTCETVRYSLQRVAVRKCCEEFKCELECKCGTGLCEQHHQDKNSEEPAPRRVSNRCLCEHLTHLNIPSDPCGELCPLEDDPCSRVRVEKAGVHLACVQLEPGDCGNWVISAVEACGPRRLVKRNDLLFDLIRGCDLTHISKIGWADWHRRGEPIPFHQFRKAMTSEDHPLWVAFSRPVQAATLTPDCFSITVACCESRSRWLQVFRAPIVQVDPTPTSHYPIQPGDPKAHVRGAKLVLDHCWIKSEIYPGRSCCWQDEAIVEIEVRGDFILDFNGQTVDANSRGLLKPPTGNSTPGGTFLSTFRVKEDQPEEEQLKEEQPFSTTTYDIDKL